MSQLVGQRHPEIPYPIAHRHQNFSYTCHAGRSPRGGCEVYHCNVRIFFREIADDSHLRLEVWGPHFLYPRHRGRWELQQRRRMGRRHEQVRRKMVVTIDERREITLTSVS